MATLLRAPDRTPPPPSPESELDLGVIEEARKRQRRRRGTLAVGLLAGLALAIMLVDRGGGGGAAARPGARHAHARPAATLAALTPPSAVFVQDPYMGVACGIANSILCDRVGLAVWLRRPARVTATIAGAPLTLDDPHWSYSVRDGDHMLYVYMGFLQPAGLRSRLHVTPLPGTSKWLGDNAPSPTVRFRIDFGHGHVVVTQESVWLNAGWG